MGILSSKMGSWILASLLLMIILFIINLIVQYCYREKANKIVANIRRKHV
jgi:Ca2+-dependent lipid-binding protein